MPYIETDKRVALEPLLTDVFRAVTVSDTGDLNYIITRLVMKWIESVGGVRYTGYNKAIGVLECVKMELYCHVVMPYEEVKREKNGDVY